MPELVPYLHGVKEIRVLERKETAPGIVHLVNEWVSDYHVPAVVSRFIKPEMLRWLDIVDWDHATHSWHWRFESKSLGSVLQAEGTNRMVADGPAATKFIIDGEINIFVEKMPGVPAFIGRRVRPQVEKFIVGLIEPRMRATDEGLSKWLDSKKAKPAPQ